MTDYAAGDYESEELGAQAGGGDDYYESHGADEEEEDYYNDDRDNSMGGNRSSAHDDIDAMVDAHMRNHAPARGGIRVDPNTPGKVVEAGQEHTGRWTKDEHEAFLSALQMYGKEWKKVAAKVKTRTVVQTRTHAQKYFQKLQKAMESGGSKGDVGHVEMGVAQEAKKASSTKKKRGAPSISTKPRPPDLGASHMLANLTSAAQSIQTPTADSQARLSSAVAFGGAAALAGAPILGGRSTQAAASTVAPTHGFSTGSDSFRSSYAAASNFGSFGDRPWATGNAMKIRAPDPDASAKSGMFPEPSPAACGKRKLAEIAAARMLAGVAAGGRPLLPPTFGGGADPDGEATPPPQTSPRQPDAPGLSLRDVPAPPLMASSAGAGVPKGLSLQIVNPDSLGYDETKRRRANGGDSPVTPWNSELEALVSEKSKEKTDEETNKKVEEADKKPPVVHPEGGVHPVCSHSSAYSRSALHKAVCDMDLANLQTLLAGGDTSALFVRDDAGYCPLHSACSLRLLGLNRPDVPCEMVRQLLAAGADPSCVDDSGCTPLHWAARAGDKDVADLLLRKNCPKDAKNKQGETPLHWAMRAGRSGMEVVDVLLENGARPSSLSLYFKRPVDVAADGFDGEFGNPAPKRQLDGPALDKRKRVSKEEKRILVEVTEERTQVRENLLKRSAQSRTLVLHHPECLEHTPKSSTDWEAPDRITAIMGRVKPPEGDVASKPVLMPYEISLSSEFERAKLDLLSRVHSTDYLAFVNDLSKELERRQKEEEEERATSEEPDSRKGGTLTPPVVPFTPMVQRSMIKIEEAHVKLGAHSDTSFSVGSLRAARRAAGAVQHAVDCVLVGRNRNAMCIVRPPGHHAGVNGLLDGGESCGFCIFNNVAAGALHAISDERLLCERCAIVDIDVHHGNGTEEIVRKCHDPGKLFFFSIHLYDNEKKKQKGNALQYKFYPGTGAEDDVAFNIINVAITPLWKEPNPDKPGGNTHNTRQKTRQKTVAPSESMDDSSEVGTPRDSKDNGRFSDADSETASTSKAASNSPGPSSTTASAPSSGRLAYRQAIQNRLLPALRAFNPDLILISAGFDAARLDVGNARHERGGERMGLDLEPEDYAWTTRKVLEVADICCQGRVVSVLEGGYGRSTPSSTHELDRSNLAECAVRHLQAMVDPYDCEGRFP